MNNIITISGDPGSGKSTVRNALKENFKKVTEEELNTFIQIGTKLFS